MWFDKTPNQPAPPPATFRELQDFIRLIKGCLMLIMHFQNDFSALQLTNHKEHSRVGYMYSRFWTWFILACIATLHDQVQEFPGRANTEFSLVEKSRQIGSSPGHKWWAGGCGGHTLSWLAALALVRCPSSPSRGSHELQVRILWAFIESDAQTSTRLFGHA